MDFEFAQDENGNPYLSVGVTDFSLISCPLLNKGMAFTQQERDEFNLVGLLPPAQTNLKIQLDRSYEAFKDKPSDIEKYIYLRDLQDSNETLFFRLIFEHIEEMTPIVYTPTVGLGCQRYSNIYRRPRGLFIAYPDKEHINKILAHPRFDRVKVIVVSDGERILGLGDQGAGGMGIPIGKLALYTACAGIHPAYTLPVLLDTGTNNQDLINNPLYIGWHHERVRGQEYDDFIDCFVSAVKKRLPHVLLHWEDFAQQNANPILTRYRDQLCTFNDDIQGTAAVAAGTLLAAINVTGKRLHEQQIVVVGAGSAGCGISNLIKQAIVDDGLTEEAARKNFFLIDQAGLLIDTMTDLKSFQQPFAHAQNDIAHWQCDDLNKITLKDVIKNVHPTVLIGVSGQPGIFTEEIIREMAAHVERPVIFILSNPTERSEATPSDLINWTEGRVIISTGSPFKDIIKNGKPFRVDQTNNAYIFPGVGLGLIAVKAKYVTDNMFMIAAKTLADCSPTKANPNANLLPPLSSIRDVSYQIALAVANEAVRANLATTPNQQNLAEQIEKLMWTPAYMPYKSSF